MILIAEIGNNHLGDIDKFKELIRAAKGSGATLVKSQAFIAKDINGSMPLGFYEKCQLQYEQYLDMIWWAKEIMGIDLFYSIFSKPLQPMSFHQRWHKFSASQTSKNPRYAEQHDTPNCIASIKEGGLKPKLKNSYIMHASEYLTINPHLENIRFLKEYYGRPVGYSDHTIGIEWCLKSLAEYRVPIIEKHFTNTRDIYFEGKQFRDAVHSAMPNELEALAKAMDL